MTLEPRNLDRVRRAAALNRAAGDWVVTPHPPDLVVIEGAELDDSRPPEPEEHDDAQT